MRSNKTGLRWSVVAGWKRWLLVAAAWLSLASAPHDARATSYIYKPLTLPHADEVAAFANNIDDMVPRKIVSRGTVLKFLAEGKNNTVVETWYQLQHRHADEQTVCDGVFTDKAGKVYFWTLNTPHVLTIISADHEQALLQL